MFMQIFTAERFFQRGERILIAAGSYTQPPGALHPQIAGVATAISLKRGAA
ncbi:hypothetical protein [Ensifer aridi]|uniref:hypothetical protein n=1 Tax=Ensifer aridi TaxID=1708715 RepID=UPI0015E370F5|nr:hypothetical protein [Ensifer aridi]